MALRVLLVAVLISVLGYESADSSPQFLTGPRIEVTDSSGNIISDPTTGPSVTTPGPPGPTTMETTTMGMGSTPSTVSTPSTLSTTTALPIIQGLPCGGSILLSQGNVVRMSSSNFGVGNYPPKETCSWDIQANQCRLEATCPCIGIPPSWNCIEGYLKIKTGLIYDFQKFCGGNKPGQAIQADGSELNIRFKGNYQRTGTGFTCFVSCIGPGRASPTLPNVPCPNNK